MIQYTKKYEYGSQVGLLIKYMKFEKRKLLKELKINMFFSAAIYFFRNEI